MKSERELRSQRRFYGVYVNVHLVGDQKSTGIVSWRLFPAIFSFKSSNFTWPISHHITYIYYVFWNLLQKPNGFNMACLNKIITSIKENLWAAHWNFCLKQFLSLSFYYLELQIKNFRVMSTLPLFSITFGFVLWRYNFILWTWVMILLKRTFSLMG